MKKLAKLRQFRSGMDAISYLETELRQNWLAIEQTFKSLGAQISSTDSTVEEEESAEVGTIFYATRQATIPAGVINISSNVIVEGTVLTNVFRPLEDGQFFIEISAQCQTTAATVGNYTITAFDTNSVSLGTINGGTPTTQVLTGPTNGFFANLGPGLGVFFQSAQAGTITVRNFYCKITRVS